MREAAKNFEDYFSYFWNPFIDGAEAALEAGKEPMLLQAESSDGDDSHGIMETVLTALDEKLPELEIVAYAVYVNTEYGGADVPNILYSPKGDSLLSAKCAMLEGRMDERPDEDWISYGWRHPDEKAPAAKAEGTVTLLGDWNEAERAIVDKALMGGALEAMSYTAFEKEHETVTRTDEGWSFSVGGAMDAGKAAQHLHLVLLPYIKEHEASYAALCRTMREKKLSIHLYLDESTGPNAAWSYCNNSAWHFLITSDGARLLSNFTWCGTYAFGSRGGSVNCKAMYEQATGEKWEALSDEGRFLVGQRITAKTAYFVCGSGVGDPFETALEYGTPPSLCGLFRGHDPITKPAGDKLPLSPAAVCIHVKTAPVFQQTEKRELSHGLT